MRTKINKTTTTVVTETIHSVEIPRTYAVGATYRICPIMTFIGIDTQLVKIKSIKLLEEFDQDMKEKYIEEYLCHEPDGLVVTFYYNNAEMHMPLDLFASCTTSY